MVSPPFLMHIPNTLEQLKGGTQEQVAVGEVLREN
jgi:hypothetical protein